MKKLLKPVSRIYQKGMSLRNYLYKSNILERYSPPTFTISVGNISWGGTGKTPFCHYLIKKLKDLNFEPMLLTRGYRGKPPKYPYLVDVRSPIEYSGDEPLMLKLLCSETPIIVDPKRERAFEFGWKVYKPDVVILDDGFQYIKLKRHVDIVILSVEDLIFNWNRSIPYGTWREDISALDRCSVILVNVTGYNLNDIIHKIEKKILPLNKPTYLFKNKIKEIVLGNDFSKKIDLKDRDYLLVAGIGQPKKVYRSAHEFIGKKPLNFLTYRDHYNYKQKDWNYIENEANKLNCCVITTLKDAVKLRKFSSNFYALKIDTIFLSNFNTHDQFIDLILKAIRKYKDSVY